MIDDGTRANASERLTRDELTALHERLGEGVDREEVGATVRDVAEACGVSEAEVLAHLRQIRAEAAFALPPEKPPSPLPWIAAATLAVGFGVTWWRLHRNDPPLTESLVATLTTTAPSSVVTRSVATTPLAEIWDERDILPPPSNLEVEAIGQRTERVSSHSLPEALAVPYETDRDGLVRSAEALIARIATDEGSAVAPAGTRYHGRTGGIFFPRPGFVRTTMSGWAGSETDWIAVPLDDAGRQGLRALATRFLAKAKKDQDAALAPVADPSEGIVAPPPDFSVRFAGRRLDVQLGPRVSFAPIPPEVVARRLEATIVNAVARDRRPPVGSWTGDAARDRKVRPPDLSRVEIMGPTDLVTADIPTRLDDAAATQKAVRELAERAARQIEGINRRAVQTDVEPKP